MPSIVTCVYVYMCICVYIYVYKCNHHINPLMVRYTVFDAVLQVDKPKSSKVKGQSHISST